MEKYIKNIKIKKQLTTLDTNNDGNEDTIAYLNKDDLYVSFILRQSIKDLGVYTDYQEPPEILDLGSFWDTSNDGSSDGGTVPITIFSGSSYGDEGDGGVTIIDSDDLETVGCTDPNAINYNQLATIDCCCDYGFEGGSSSSGGSQDAGSAGGGCFTLSSGCVDNGDVPDFFSMLQSSSDWCEGSHPSCSSAYPTTPNCQPNGCGNANTEGCASYGLSIPCVCCPGPAGSYTILSSTLCTEYGYDCNGNSCNCGGSNQNPFDGISNVQTTSCGDGKSTRSWQFYCVPN